MSIGFEFTFEGSLPDLAIVLQKLEENTGLTGIKYESGAVTHSYFEHRWFGMTKEKGMINILSIKSYMFYLLEATMATLIKMGGKYDATEWNVRDVAFRKWEEVKDEYEETNLL